MNCLMIETKDGKKLFTYKENFRELTEYAKTFDVSMSLVNVEAKYVMDLLDLAYAICVSDHHKTPAYEVVKSSKNRELILKTANKIQDYIKKQFANREIVSLSDLKEKFKEYNLTTACFCNHIRKVISRLNMKVRKLAAGKYTI